MENFISLEKAISLSRGEVKDNYRDYINSGLATLFGLLNFDKLFVRAEGVSVWDAEGNEYLDFLGGYGALNLGHNHPEVIKAVDKVASLPNILQASVNGVASALAYNLSQLVPGGAKKVFFCNSGAEAVEGALKLARAATRKSRIIYCEGSFHGKSFGALSVTGREKYQKAFYPLLPGCEAVIFGDTHALEEKCKQGDVAAFIIEPIQGEGGIIVPPDGYLKRAKSICEKYGVLFIADEIQTGLGRTGKLFACEHDGVEPDIMCIAKSLGGGVMPAGAYVANDDVWQKAYGGVEKCTLHTSTFGGNTRAMAAGIATLEVLINDDLSRQAAEKGEYLLSKLNELAGRYPLVKEVRGRGLMIGIEFTEEKGFLNKITGGLVNKFANEYLGALVAGELHNKYRIITAYTLNNPNVIRIEPPLTITYEQIDKLINALEEIFSSYKGFLGVATAGVKSVLGGLLKRN